MASAPAMEGAAATALRSVLTRVQQAAERSGRSPEQVRVVAVSKTKPVSLIRQVYDAGHRYFGENYVQEITEKAPQLPADIEWHFIGHLQSNKVKPLLAEVPNLEMVESVDNEKIANHLDRVVASLGRRPLKVLVQVNTSGEESKFGVDPSGCVELAKHVKLVCTNLVFSGLMTIGMLDYTSTPENFKVQFLKSLEAATQFIFLDFLSEACVGWSRHCQIAELRSVMLLESQRNNASCPWACLPTLSKQSEWEARMSELDQQYLGQGNTQRRIRASIALT